MSQQSSDNREFIPPPPPSEKDTFVPPPPPDVDSDSPFEQRTLIEKRESVGKAIIWAYGLGIASFPWCVYMLIVFPPYTLPHTDAKMTLGAFLSFIGSGMAALCALGLANNAVQTIDYYSVAKKKRPVATIGKLISLFTILVWILGLVVVVFLWQHGILYQIGLWLIEQQNIEVY